MDSLTSLRVKRNHIENDSLLRRLLIAPVKAQPSLISNKTVYSHF